MPKCEIIWAINVEQLEYKINKFIKDKKVISVSMQIEDMNTYYACIIYEEWSEC